MENKPTMQKVIGGLGEKTSNNGTQYYQQDRVYDLADIATCVQSQLVGGGTKFVEIIHLGSVNEHNK